MISALLSGLFAWLMSPVTRWLRDREIRAQMRAEAERDAAMFTARTLKNDIVEGKQNEQAIAQMDKENLVQLNAKLRDAYQRSRMRRD